MATKELTKQAFALYDNIRAQSYRVSDCSENRARLYFLSCKAFYRYKRRLKAE
ncbi:hypothetical protein [Methylobacter sp.]|uniref:hypothetical protein n=1 Tax=Methylobacter sp. TaxID=2051955 RepID=UPI002FDD4FCE